MLMTFFLGLVIGVLIGMWIAILIYLYGSEK